MAVTNLSNFRFNDAVAQVGATEVLSQNSDAFNAASRGAITMTTRARPAVQYERQAIYDVLANGAISRRDLTSNSAVTPVALTQDEDIKVALARKIGPIDAAMDTFQQLGRTPNEMSLVIGEQTGKAMSLDMLNTALIGLTAAVGGKTAATFSAIGGTTETMTHAHLVSGLAKFGDRGQAIVAWVMHSKVYYDLMQQAIADKVFEVAGVTINDGSLASLGRPVIVTDSSALVFDNSGTNNYYTLGLCAGACSIDELGQRNTVIDTITGNEQLVLRYQGEYNLMLGIKGYQWDIAKGGANPSNTALGTSTNWDNFKASVKDTAGIAIVTE